MRLVSAFQGRSVLTLGKRAALCSCPARMCTSSVSEAEFHRVADATMDDLCEYLDEVAERDAAESDDIDVSNSVRVCSWSVSLSA